MSRPVISLIAAVARNGAIGAGNALPWRIPSDLKRFKALTMGKPIVMGRKTFESIGKALPGRETIVLTREAGWSRAGVAVAHDLEAALRLAGGADEVMIGGGGEIYAATIGMADRLYITEVDLEPVAEVIFPRIDPEAWKEVAREIGDRGPKDEAGFTFVDYARPESHARASI